MKKAFALFLTLALVLSLSVLSAAAGNSGKNSTKEPRTNSKAIDETADLTTEVDSESQTATETNEGSTFQQGKKQTDLKKQFRTELNQQKKELQQQNVSLEQQKKELETQYEALLTSGDTTGAEAVLEKISLLKEQIIELKIKMKQTINERYMVVKTMYSDTELAQFDNAASLIAQMYADANVLDVGSVTVNNNIIKFDAPPYIKGGVTLVPLRTISEQLGAEVSWDEDSQTVTISKDDIVITVTANSTTVLVNGTPSEISSPAKVTCGRTYLPLRFLAETLEFNVAWDDENEIIDIDDGSATDTATDTDTVTDTDNATDTDTNTNTNSTGENTSSDTTSTDTASTE